MSWFFILGALFGSIAIFQLGEVALKLGRIARALERIADALEQSSKSEALMENKP